MQARITPKKIRLIKFKDEANRELIFLTNNFSSSSSRNSTIV